MERCDEKRNTKDYAIIESVSWDRASADKQKGEEHQVRKKLLAGGGQRLLSCMLFGIFILSAAVAGMAQDGLTDIEAVKGARKAVLPVEAIPSKWIEPGLSDFRHELWGRTTVGEGYIYGPANRRAGMAAVDIDLDGDSDFVFPNSIGNPQLMRNLGSSNVFYPGGSQDLNLDPLPAGMEFSLSMDFADLTGDSLPDLAIVTERIDPYRREVVWFRNEGPRENPRFSYQGLIYQSNQIGRLPGLWVAFGDIYGNGRKDLFVAEDFVTEASRHHRVFLLRNTGTASNPVWASPVEITELSQLMPDRIDLGLLKKSEAALPPIALPLTQSPDEKSSKAGVAYNLGDIAIADWDSDGVLDFLFYDKSQGLFWIRNLGLASFPIWDFRLAHNGMPIYDHHEEDGLDFAEATIALRANPEAAQPGVEWLRDVFISVNSLLKTYRFFVAEDAYRIVKANPVAYPAGQGKPVFWDYDGDGDLDLFRMGILDSGIPNLLLFENVGTAYSPVWGDVSVIYDIELNNGNAANEFRQDLFIIHDHDTVHGPDLFIQRQDGRISLYWAFPPTTLWGLPSFSLHDDNFGDVVYEGLPKVQPRGIAAADFDAYEDGWSEFLVAYAYDGGARLMMIDSYLDETYDVSDLIPSPWGVGALDPGLIEDLAAVDLNLDGIPDLVVSISEDIDYSECELHYYQNELISEWPYFRFVYQGRIETPYQTNRLYGRMVGFADIDGDGDEDLFVGHRYPDWSGERNFIRFYRNTNTTGLQYVRFRVTSGREWPLHLTLTRVIGGESQSVDVEPQYELIRNASGGTLLGNANYLAGDNAPAVDILQTTDLIDGYDFTDEVRSYVDVLPAVGRNESKAILVVGDTADGALYPTFLDLAGFAYRVLISEGLPKESIRLYADGNFDADFDGVNDVAGRPTLSGLENAIKTWAPSWNPAEPLERLLVYLIDHGQRGRFRLNGDEYLEASVYHTWLNHLQSIQANVVVTTLIDSCESGSFIMPLGGPRRITMTSAGMGPIEGIALFDKNSNISFSQHFWLRLYNGDSYGQAFSEAKTAIEAINPLQAPQIDDNGDGIGNDASDGLIANTLRPGADFGVRSSGIYIGEIAPSRAINSNSAQLWIGDVVTSLPVEGAKAIVVPPNFERPNGGEDEQPVSDLPSVLFNFDETTGRWFGTYSHFTQGGLYQIQYFVKTGGQYYASPRIGFIDRTNRPDAWEPDNAQQDASWIFINSVQGHNFHVQGDLDWARFTSPRGEKATIAAIKPGPRCQPVIELYREADLEANPAAPPVQRAESTGPGRDVVFEYSFTNAESYLLKVFNMDPQMAGEGTSYLLLVAVGTGGSDLLATSLVVTVMDRTANTPLAGVNVNLGGNSAGRTTAQGVAHVVVPSYGNYTVAAQKSGYKTVSQTVRINKMIEQATLYLSEGTDEQKGCAACGVNPSRPREYLGDLLLILGALTVLSIMGRRRSAV